MRTLPAVCAIATLGLVTAIAAPAMAQPAGVPAPIMATPPPPPKPLPMASVTISPVHLIFPMLEVTGEVRVNPKIGVAGIVGFGTVDVSNSTDTVSIFELGASGRYYAMGNFRTGLQLGAEVLYLGASAEDGQTTATASGLQIGAFIGYKWTASFGLTLEAQGGIATYAIKAESNGGTTDEDSAVIPLLNLNIGWSF